MFRELVTHVQLICSAEKSSSRNIHAKRCMSSLSRISVSQNAGRDQAMRSKKFKKEVCDLPKVNLRVCEPNSRVGRWSVSVSQTCVRSPNDQRVWTAEIGSDHLHETLVRKMFPLHGARCLAKVTTGLQGYRTTNHNHTHCRRHVQPRGISLVDRSNGPVNTRQFPCSIKPTFFQRLDFQNFAKKKGHKSVSATLLVQIKNALWAANSQPFEDFVKWKLSSVVLTAAEIVLKAIFPHSTLLPGNDRCVPVKQAPFLQEVDNFGNYWA